jgi:hypothetical protein
MPFAGVASALIAGFFNSGSKRAQFLGGILLAAAALLLALVIACAPCAWLSADSSEYVECLVSITDSLGDFALESIGE